MRTRRSGRVVLVVAVTGLLAACGPWGGQPPEACTGDEIDALQASRQAFGNQRAALMLTLAQGNAENSPQLTTLNTQIAAIDGDLRACGVEVPTRGMFDATPEPLSITLAPGGSGNGGTGTVTIENVGAPTDIPPGAIVVPSVGAGVSVGSSTCTGPMDTNDTCTVTINVFAGSEDSATGRVSVGNGDGQQDLVEVIAATA